MASQVVVFHDLIGTLIKFCPTSHLFSAPGAISYSGRLHSRSYDLFLQPTAFRFCLLQQILPAVLSPAYAGFRDEVSFRLRCAIPEGAGTSFRCDSGPKPSVFLRPCLSNLLAVLIVPSGSCFHSLHYLHSFKSSGNYLLISLAVLLLLPLTLLDVLSV
jgi:hypothetical protein